MNSFQQRALSAVAAVAAVIALLYFAEKRGMQILICFGVVVGTRELISMLFKDVRSRSSRVIFYILSVLIFALSSLNLAMSGAIFACVAVVFSLLTLLIQNKFENLQELADFQAKSLLGFFYVGLLPSFAMQILELPQGIGWFLTLMAVVLCGDTGAYLSGWAFGKHKLMPMVSPKKTIEGAIGGLFSSMIAGAVAAHYLGQPTLPMALLALAAGIVGQFGDLFESLLKRVADVKDSGQFMPGHGGILDRIDGVLFASPVMLIGGYFLSRAPSF